MTARVYMGPLGSTQLVQGATGGGGGGGLKTIFAQSPGPVTYPGQPQRQTLFGVVPFVLGPGASDFCVDFFAAFACAVPTFVDAEFTVESDLDGVPGSLVTLQGQTIVAGAGVRTVNVGGVACLPPFFIPPGPHTIEWFVSTPVDLNVLSTNSAFASFRGFWTE